MGKDPTQVHPVLSFTDLAHQRIRLGILLVLAESGCVDFTYLEEVLQLTPGNLGRHLRVLENGGLVRVTKGYEGKRPRTRAALSRAGEKALADEMAAMKLLVQRFESRENSTAKRASIGNSPN
jgi:DNA-binding MarR family transcriptional regulator